MDMENKNMERMLTAGTAIDVSQCPVNEDGNYDITNLWLEGTFYCNRVTEEWIWSVGRDNDTRQVWASHQMDYYASPGFECLWIKDLK